MTHRKSTGFTLVELLVVIGIIALLISILLPSLQSARAAAETVKCATQQREIGNAMRLYAHDYKNFYPPAQLNMAAGNTYEVDGDDYPISGYGAYWFNFINRYVASAKAGLANDSDGDAASVRDRSVIWGCGAWQGYYRNSSNDSIDFNRIQVGYGMNAYPYFRSNMEYGESAYAADEVAYDFSWAKGDKTGFIKADRWGVSGSERMLIADSRFWLAAADTPPADGTIPSQMGDFNRGNTRSDQTYLSVWRHGTLPDADPDVAYSYKSVGGKPGFNILYADGHVATTRDISEAYRSIRMRFPG